MCWCGGGGGVGTHMANHSCVVVRCYLLHTTISDTPQPLAAPPSWAQGASARIPHQTMPPAARHSQRHAPHGSEARTRRVRMCSITQRDPADGHTVMQKYFIPYSLFAVSFMPFAFCFRVLIPEPLKQLLPDTAYLCSRRCRWGNQPTMQLSLQRPAALALIILRA